LGVSSEVKYAEKMAQYMRASVRLNSRAKLSLEWREGGQTHSVQGYTVDISPKGCLAIAPQGFAVGQKLRLTNSSNQHGSEAILIWRGHEGREGWELGLELINPPADFWGIEF